MENVPQERKKAKLERRLHCMASQSSLADTTVTTHSPIGRTLDVPRHVCGIRRSNQPDTLLQLLVLDLFLVFLPHMMGVLRLLEKIELVHHVFKRVWCLAVRGRVRTERRADVVRATAGVRRAIDGRQGRWQVLW